MSHRIEFISYYKTALEDDNISMYQMETLRLEIQ